ncbi:MAG: phage portal protein [Alphaproteobacteria bacterium]|nr:phage portal protein [Alphaproteobacteria bacterium]
MFARLWRREEKASAAGPLVALHGQGRPRWAPRDYGAFAREGFMKNPVAYRAVRMIAEAAASVPLVLYEGAREADAHPLLALIARPNASETGAGFLERLYAGLEISGNAYVEAVRLEGVTRELYALRADRVRVVPGPDGWPSGYVYAAGGRETRLPGADVLHLKLFHPADDHYGLSPLEAAGQAVDLHNAMAGWNKALLDNAARPSGALVYRGQPGAEALSDAQFARLKAELQEAQQGARHAGRAMVLDGGLEWRAMGLTPQEMDFDRGRNAAARDIAMAFGVPPMLLGVPGDATYANYEQANLAFWRQTVLPLVRRVCAGLSAWLGPGFGAGLRLDVDADGVEALSAERGALWARLEAAGFITRDEKRVAAGYGVKG